MDTEIRKIELGSNYFLHTESKIDFDQEQNEHWLFLNGLSDSIQSWNDFRQAFFSEALEKSNYSFIDLRGQGKSLEQSLTNDPHTSFDFSIHTHVDDILQFLNTKNLTNKKLHVVGNSFGGAIAIALAHRIPVAEIFLLVPYTIRLDHSFPMQRIVRWQWDMSKRMGLLPHFISHPIETNYKKFLTHYMNFRFENKLNDPQHRRAAIEQTHGIINFNGLANLQNIKCNRIHLISSNLDTLVPQTLYREFWDRLPTNKKATWLQIENGEHLLLEQAPKFVANWIRLLSSEQKNLQLPLVLSRKIDSNH